MECMKDLANWGMYEIEDIGWDELVKGNNHGVTQGAGEQVNESEVVNVENRSEGGGIATGAKQRKEQSSFRATVEVGRSSILDGSWPPPCRVSEFAIEASTAQLDTGTHDINLSDDEQKGKEFDPMDYDWPDVGILEDIDPMLRNCDTVFGQGRTCSADELSWFSPSHAAYGSDDTYEFAFQSSCSELSPLHNASFDNGSRTSFLPENELVNAYNNHSSFGCHTPSNWMGPADISRRQQKSNEQVRREQDDTGVSIPPKFKDGDRYDLRKDRNMVAPQSKELNKIGSSEFTDPIPVLSTGHIHNSVNRKSSSPSVAFPQTNMLTPDQCSLAASASSSLTGTSSTLGRMEFDIPSHHSLVGTEDFPYRALKTATLGIENKKKISKHQIFQLEGGSNKSGNQHMKLPSVELEGSAVQDNSSPASAFDMPPEAASFQHLQDVMDQLDVRTKLCIRDSLYRLAKSAEQRYGHAGTSGHIEDSNQTLGHNLDGSKEYDKANCRAGMADADADTNPIDRSIMHLLFHGPPPGFNSHTFGAFQESNTLLNRQACAAIGGEQAAVAGHFDGTGSSTYSSLKPPPQSN